MLPAESETPFDGILGIDFLRIYDAIYDLKEEALRLDTGGKEERIPFIGLATKMVVVRPRCEYRCRVHTLVTGAVVTRSEQLANGVYLDQATTAVQENGVAYEHHEEEV